jgi:hypothetical protein
MMDLIKWIEFPVFFRVGIKIGRRGCLPGTKHQEGVPDAADINPIRERDGVPLHSRPDTTTMTFCLYQPEEILHFVQDDVM